MKYRTNGDYLIVCCEDTDRLLNFEKWFNANYSSSFRTLRWTADFSNAVKYFKTKEPTKVIEDYSAAYIDNIFGFLMEKFTIADIVLFMRSHHLSYNDSEELFLKIKLVKFENKLITSFEDKDFWVDLPTLSHGVIVEAFSAFCKLFEDIVGRKLEFDDSHLVILKLQL